MIKVGDVVHVRWQRPVQQTLVDEGLGLVTSIINGWSTMGYTVMLSDNAIKVFSADDCTVVSSEELVQRPPGSS